MYELHCRRFQNREVEIVYRSLALNLDLANLILPYKYVLATWAFLIAVGELADLCQLQYDSCAAVDLEAGGD